jgi:hypothetical protein
MLPGTACGASPRRGGDRPLHPTRGVVKEILLLLLKKFSALGQNHAPSRFQREPIAHAASGYLLLLVFLQGGG